MEHHRRPGRTREMVRPCLRHRGIRTMARAKCPDPYDDPANALAFHHFLAGEPYRRPRPIDPGSPEGCAHALAAGVCVVCAYARWYCRTTSATTRTRWRDGY